MHIYDINIENERAELPGVCLCEGGGGCMGGGYSL